MMRIRDSTTALARTTSPPMVLAKPFQLDGSYSPSAVIQQSDSTRRSKTILRTSNSAAWADGDGMLDLDALDDIMIDPKLFDKFMATNGKLKRVNSGNIFDRWHLFPRSWWWSVVDDMDYPGSGRERRRAVRVLGDPHFVVNQWEQSEW